MPGLGMAVSVVLAAAVAAAAAAAAAAAPSSASRAPGDAAAVNLHTTTTTPRGDSTEKLIGEKQQTEERGIGGEVADVHWTAQTEAQGNETVATSPPPNDVAPTNSNISVDLEEGDTDFVEARIAKNIDLYGGLTFLIIGTIGNSMSIAVLTRERLRHTITGQYLIVLAVCDLLSILIGQAGRHVIRTVFKYDIPNEVNWYCKTWYFGFYMASTYSNWILAAVSVERCLAVSMPLKASIIFTRKRARFYLLLLLVVITAYNSHMFISYQVVVTDKVKNTTSCGINVANYFAREVRPWADFTFKAIGPGMLIVISNAIIIYKLFRMQKRRSKMSNQANDAAHLMAMVPMLVTISVAFLCLTSPIHVTYVVNAFYPATYKPGDHGAAVMRLIWSVNVLCLYVNHAVNFFLYVISGREFRTELIKMLLCRDQRVKKKSRSVNLGSLQHTKSMGSSSTCIGSTSVG